jgi:hypothetical protein
MKNIRRKKVASLLSEIIRKTVKFRPGGRLNRRDGFKFSSWWRQYILAEKGALSCVSPDPAQLLIQNTFRDRFRFPYAMYESLVKACKGDDMFGSSTLDASFQEKVPIELKILGVLRVLARGVCFDEVAEYCNTKPEIHRVFFHLFCIKFIAKYRHVHIVAPTTDSEISHSLRMYERLGFPGCVGSVDCTHIPWDRCPAEYRSIYVGKEGFPKIAYEVTCDHTHKILSVTPGHYGGRTDLTIVKFDGFINSLRRNSVYCNKTYMLEDIHGVRVESKGVYVICDNGYHRRWSHSEQSSAVYRDHACP